MSRERFTVLTKIPVLIAADGVVVTFIDDPDADRTQEGVIADAAGNIYASLTGGMALRKYTGK